MLRPRRAVSKPSLPVTFDICSVPNERLQIARATVELDGPLSDPAWQLFSDAVLPDGLFIARECATARLVGTASACAQPAREPLPLPRRRRTRLSRSGARVSWPRSRCRTRCGSRAPFRNRWLSPRVGGSAGVAAAGDSHLSGRRLQAVSPHTGASSSGGALAPIFAELGREVDTALWPRRLFDDTTRP